MTAWLDQLVTAFGAECTTKLAGAGDREATIRSPLEALLLAAARHMGIDAVFHDEVRDGDRRVRHDYTLSVGHTVTGYVEVKAPGTNLDPSTFRGHNLAQWERLRDLPNLLYTNGTEWRLYESGEPIADEVRLTGGPLDAVAGNLACTDDFEALLSRFLHWGPQPITSVTKLVRSLAPLTRLLRGEVVDKIAAEREAIKYGADPGTQPFLGLARDWRSLLFPQASDAAFADGYAQAVSFALLLARSEDIDVATTPLHEIGSKLGESHSLMGRAVQLLTDHVETDFRVTLDLLTRVIGAVDWKRVSGGARDTYLHLYESFLDVYDPELRKRSGSYYTPREVVEEMTRMTSDVLRTRLGTDFGEPNVVTVDPAMGTGTYLLTILESVRLRQAAAEGEGFGAAAVTTAAANVVGFELQMGPFAVAELRTSDLLRRANAKPPKGGMRMFVTNTLDDPYADVAQLGSGLGAISASRIAANTVKARTPVTVVIGNPPYAERAEGEGGWIELGPEADRKSGKRAKVVPLDGYRLDGNGRNEYVLKNLYVYFWRWATWKVFEAHQDDSSGVVCFITTSGYVRGPGFRGMREYLRRTCSEGWIIDVSPEGMQPEVSTRLFPGVQQPLAIGIFIRRPDTDRDTAATIKFTSIAGRRQEKHAALRAMQIDGDGWRDARTDWHAPFTPAADSSWDDFPAIGDLMPWVSPGVKANRTWVISPSQGVLRQRWRSVVDDDAESKATKFKQTDSTLATTKAPLPGLADHPADQPFSAERRQEPTLQRVAFRAFDRHWLIPDSRLIDRPRTDLWSALPRSPLFVIEQHSDVITDGPALLFSTLLPDMHYFNNRGGRTLPSIHPDGSSNTAPGLLAALTAQLGVSVHVDDLVAYAAAVAAHPSFTETFTDELTTPGVRIPITADPDVWSDAVKLGHSIVWAQTFGEAFVDPDHGRPRGGIRLTDSELTQPMMLHAITSMPTEMSYDEATLQLTIGDGVWGPVDPAVWDYAVGGRNVLHSWFGYRKLDPAGKKTSPLDRLHVDTWDAEWSRELNDLLAIVTRLVDMESAQSVILDRVLAGPMLDKRALAERGVSWPSQPKDRAARQAAEATGLFGGE